MNGKSLVVFFNPKWYPPVNLEAKVAADEEIIWKDKKSYQEEENDNLPIRQAKGVDESKRQIHHC